MPNEETVQGIRHKGGGGGNLFSCVRGYPFPYHRLQLHGTRVYYHLHKHKKKREREREREERGKQTFYLFGICS